MKFRAPDEYAQRPTGCIDTPFISPDHRSTTTGVQCGREASPATMVLRGRVVSETIALDWEGVAPGRYRLALGWYHPHTLARLPASDGDRTVQDGWAVLATLDR